MVQMLFIEHYSLNRIPLHYCVSNQHVETAKLLIQKGAFINHKNSAGQTPEDLAVASGNVAMQQLFHRLSHDLDMVTMATLYPN